MHYALVAITVVSFVAAMGAACFFAGVRHAEQVVAAETAAKATVTAVQKAL